MNKWSPLVSAIITTYKSESFIAQCIENLIAQTLYKKGLLEIIIIDSASPEDEGLIVGKYQNSHPHINYLRTKKREGMYIAWNRAIKLSNGKYITNTNTDDYHDDKFMEILSQKLENRPEIGAAYGNAVMVGPLSNKKPNTFFPNRFFFAPSILLYNIFGYQLMWRKNLHDTIGFFNERYKKASDYDFALAICSEQRAIYIPEAIGYVNWSTNTQTLEDNIINEEIAEIKKKWLTPNNVLKHYKNEGIIGNTKDTIASIYHDLANRFLCFFPQWKQGTIEIDINQAIQFYTHSLKINSNEKTLSNLVITHLINGDQEYLPTLLEENNFKLSENKYIKDNFYKISNFITKKSNDLNVHLFDSQLRLETEDSFASQTKDKTYLVKDFENPEIFNINIYDLWNNYLGIKNNSFWSQIKKVSATNRIFLYGVSQRGLIFSQIANSKGIDINAFIDSSKQTTNNNKNEIKIINSKDLTQDVLNRSKVILMTSQHHWGIITKFLMNYINKSDIITADCRVL